MVAAPLRPDPEGPDAVGSVGPPSLVLYDPHVVAVGGHGVVGLGLDPVVGPRAALDRVRLAYAVLDLEVVIRGVDDIVAAAEAQKLPGWGWSQTASPILSLPSSPNISSPPTMRS